MNKDQIGKCQSCLTCPVSDILSEVFKLSINEDFFGINE